MFPIFTPSAVPTSREVETDRWHAQAEADYALCRAFADRHDAHLKRSLAGLRVGWEKMGRAAYGILLPDPLPCAGSDDDWYLYYVWGEVLLRRTLTERSERQMIVLAESVDDWAELLQQALRSTLGDSRYEVVPDYSDALGETEDVPCGFRFRLIAHAPGAVRLSDLCVTGQGETPRAAARDACLHWLEEFSSAEV